MMPLLLYSTCSLQGVMRLSITEEFNLGLLLMRLSEGALQSC